MGQQPSATARHRLPGGEVAFQPSGVFSVRAGDTTVVSLGQVMVFGPGWEAGYQASAEPLSQPAPRGQASFAGRITEPASGKQWEYRETVTRQKQGVRFEYELRPLASMTVAEVSLVMDLPIETFAGQQLLLPPRQQMTFPVAQPPDYHFVSGVTLNYVFGAGQEHQTSVALDRARVCNVQDTRQWQGDSYQAFIKIIGERRQVTPGETWNLAFTVTPGDTRTWEASKVELKSREPLEIKGIGVAPQRPRQWQLVTLTVDLHGTWDTPFWAEQVALDAVVRAPSGKLLTVPGFYTLDYERSQSEGMEILVAVGKPKWQVRLLPTEAGQYNVTLTARDTSGRVQGGPVSFRAQPAVGNGLVRVSARDRRYFAFDSGSPYFANGLNVCWYRGEGGTYDYDQWFNALGDAGGNFARIWMPEWAFGFEWGKPGEYRLDRAWQMDYVLQLAERRGIYIKLCLEAFRTFEGDNPYAQANGGPCAQVIEVFTNDEAKRMWHNRLRYAVARWGCSPHIMAWEFWNEINCVEGYQEKPVQAWAREMAQYLRQTDPYQHLIVNSLGSFVLEPDLWAMPEMDFAQVHGYWHPTWMSTEFGKDMAGMMQEWVGNLRPFNKPALFAEFGLVNETWGGSPRMDDDPEGVHLHNGIWGSAMCGAAGTAMLWWWDNYVHPRKLYYHYAAFAKFAKGVEWDRQGFEPFEAQTRPAGLRALGLRGRTQTLLWVQNRAHTWWNVAEKNPIPPVEQGSVTLDNAQPGSYTVELWDTYTGERLSATLLKADGGKLEIALPLVECDIAAKILRR